MTRSVALVLALAVVVAGCASGEPTPEERIDAALLRLSDFPPDEGWAIEPDAVDDPGQAEFEAELDRCDEQHDPTVGSRAAERDSDVFARGELVSVTSTAAVVSDANLRGEFFTALDPLMECFGTALGGWLRTLLSQDTSTVDNSEAGGVVVSAPYRLAATTEADRTEARALQVGVQYGDRLNFFVDVIVIEQDAILLSAAFLHQGELELTDLEGIFAPAVKRLQEL
jgi:hypothetical protein